MDSRVTDGSVDVGVGIDVGGSEFESLCDDELINYRFGKL